MHDIALALGPIDKCELVARWRPDAVMLRLVRYAFSSSQIRCQPDRPEVRRVRRQFQSANEDILD
jgi:hypothetical protein